MKTRESQMNGWMFGLCALIGLGLVACGQEGGTDEPQVVVDETGAQRVTFLSQDFRDLQGGGLTEDGYHVAMAHKFSACVFKTPPVAIAHEAGMAEISLDLSMDWTGFLKLTRPDLKIRETNFAIFVAYQDEKGQVVKEEVEYFHTGLSRNVVMDFDRGDGWYHFIVDTGGFVKHALATHPVQKNESIFVEVCNVTPMTDVTFKQVEVRTYPVSAD